MTEKQAHQFVARWSRLLITWRTRNEAEQLRDLNQSWMGALGGALLMATCALSWGKESLARSAGESFAVLVGGFSFWMILQLRQVKRALNQSQIGDRKL